MSKDQVLLITGSRKGIGRYLVTHYLEKGFQVVGCSREPADDPADRYKHFCLDLKGRQSIASATPGKSPM